MHCHYQRLWKLYLLCSCWWYALDRNRTLWCYCYSGFFQQRKLQQPFLALVTEPDACSSYDRISETAAALEKALQTNLVTLVSIRILQIQEQQELFNQLCSRIKEFIDREGISCLLIVNSVNGTSMVLEHGLDGLHVKQRDIETIPKLRESLKQQLIIGASVHTIESAMQAAACGADYLFVGTCFKTKSHPDKTTLEGPELPGQIQNKLLEMGYPLIPCFAIGGIDEQNCVVPINAGASGVAVIRAVLRSPNPAQTTLALHQRMRM